MSHSLNSSPTRKKVPSLDIKNMLNKVSPRTLLNRIGSPKKSHRSLNTSPVRLPLDSPPTSPPSPTHTGSQLSISSSSTKSSITDSSSSGRVSPFQKRTGNYLSRSASNVKEHQEEYTGYRRSRRDTYDEDHCYTCDDRIQIEDGVLLALKCNCSEIKSFCTAYCLKIHWIYNDKCKFVSANNLDKPVTLEDVYSQEHLYDSAESEEKI